MPRYRLTYTLETPLTCAEDISFTSAGFPVTLGFSHPVDGLHVRIDAVADGETWREANENAMDNVISPVLDALALHRKAPAMLQNLLYVVKGGEGPIRRAIVIENRNEQRGVHLDAPAINEVQKFLDRMPQMNNASMRWLRYCYRPINTLERFVYSWLAFENFLGTKQVHGKCPSCEGNLPPHPSINREAGLDLISSASPNLTAKDCKRTFREWWIELRSAIFHGGRVANTAIRSRMLEAMNLYRPAIESQLQENAKFKFAYTGKTPNDGLIQHNIYHFIEFKTEDVVAEFAEPPALTRVVEERKLPAGVALLNFQAETEHW